MSVTLVCNTTNLLMQTRGHLSYKASINLQLIPKEISCLSNRKRSHCFSSGGCLKLGQLNTLLTELGKQMVLAAYVNRLHTDASSFSGGICLCFHSILNFSSKGFLSFPHSFYWPQASRINNFTDST